MQYVYNWRGHPLTPIRAAESRSLGQPPGWIEKPSPGLGLFELSRNEQRLLMIGAVGVGAFVIFRHLKKGRRRR